MFGPAAAQRVPLFAPPGLTWNDGAMSSPDTIESQDVMPAEPSLAIQPEAAPYPLHVEGLRGVDPLLTRARWIAQIPGHIMVLALLAGAITLWAVLGWWWPTLIAAVFVIMRATTVILTPRRVRALGYLERDEDLVIARGIMFRTINTVPFGRVQSVDISQGPVERRYGLARLTVSTAGSAAAGSLHGLPKAEAERLRVLLTERGIDLMAAL